MQYGETRYDAESPTLAESPVREVSPQGQAAVTETVTEIGVREEKPEHMEYGERDTMQNPRRLLKALYVKSHHKGKQQSRKQ
ncbi:hypothetical protein KIN20_021860 [Parelaphostrongylus tenuis]|uniref:Uncharacterized protein n=1 Tax=Parelaphostrongylus tenuis TaxID=148309 RepID=A0AAD5QUY5_PARTN|nr:hypothetical protein KIN20_021860 [Parelaphostrongylus tenuis]